MVHLALENRGFTLIEIIIVVVILGILAAVALPKITENIDKARAAEAFNFMGSTIGSLERCIDEDNLGQVITQSLYFAGSCFDFNQMKIIDPATGDIAAPGVVGIQTSNFRYWYLHPGWLSESTESDPVAKFGARKIGDPPTGQYDIIFKVHIATGEITKSCGNREFKKMCK